MKNLRYLLVLAFFTSVSFYSCDYEFPDDEMIGTWNMLELVVPDGGETKAIHNGDEQWESLASDFGFNKLIFESNLTYSYIDYWGNAETYTWERIDEDNVRLWKNTNSIIIKRDDEKHYTFYKKDDINLLEVKWGKQ